MDCARAQIKAVTESKSSTESDMLLILAALAAKHAYTAFQPGYQRLTPNCSSRHTPHEANVELVGC